MTARLTVVIVSYTGVCSSNILDANQLGNLVITNKQQHCNHQSGQLCQQYMVLENALRYEHNLFVSLGPLTDMVRNPGMFKFKSNNGEFGFTDIRRTDKRLIWLMLCVKNGLVWHEMQRQDMVRILTCTQNISGCLIST